MFRYVEANAAAGFCSTSSSTGKRVSDKVISGDLDRADRSTRLKLGLANAEKMILFFIQDKLYFVDMSFDSTHVQMSYPKMITVACHGCANVLSTSQGLDKLELSTETASKKIEDSSAAVCSRASFDVSCRSCVVSVIGVYLF